MRFLTVFFILLTTAPVSALEKPISQMGEKDIDRLIRETYKKTPSAPKRLLAYSEWFLGVPFGLWPLGEGPKGEFDRDPLMRFDQADCTTFVETAMAMTLSKNLKKAKKILQKIRYKNGEIKYETRNHFTEADWIPNNIEAGFIQDITQEVGGKYTAYNVKIIYKNRWYESKELTDIQGFNNLEARQSQKLLEKLKAKARLFPHEEHTALAYLPLKYFSALGPKIPSGAIFSIIRADLPDKETMVSHQGFIIQKENGPYVRHVAWKGATEDVPLLAYFQKYENSSWPVLGINLCQLKEKGR